MRRPTLIAALICSTAGAAASSAPTPRTDTGHAGFGRSVANLASPNTVHLPLPPDPSRVDHADQQPKAPEPTPAHPPPNLSIQPTSETADQTGDPSVLLPFDPSVGAAAFQQRDQLVVVFDTERPIDLSPLQDDPVFSKVAMNILPDASVMRLPVPSGTWAALKREPDGWRIVLQTRPPKRIAVATTLSHDQLSWVIHEPGQVVRITDDVTGSPLLVGTVRASAPAVLVPRNAPQFVLRPTILGVVVESLAERLALEVRPHGFALNSPGAPLHLTQDSPELSARADGVGLTTRFGLSAEPQNATFRGLRAEMAAAALLPPVQRASAERDVARKMIALGMGAEAEAMLRLAAIRDPQEMQLADYQGLFALAALIAHRLPESGPINEQELSGTDEVTLWRALRGTLSRDNPDKVGPQLASTWPLILSYGPALKQRLLRITAEALIESGNLPAAQSLLQAEPSLPVLALARAMLAEARGDTDAALTGYNALAHARDPLVRVRAIRRAIELRLATHQLTSTQAADAYNKLVAAWHGGHIECAIRERLADLLAKSDRWRQSLAELRALEGDFPDQAQAIRNRRKAAFTAFLTSHGGQTLSPLDFLATVHENADVQPDGAAGIALQIALADRLVALDLTDRAARILQKLADSAPSPTARAEFATRLARLRLREGNTQGALDALNKSNSPDLPAPLTEQRTIIRSTALGRLGNVEQALSLLTGLNTPPADRLRADILEQNHNWPGAEDALRDLVARVVPASGSLTDAQRNILLQFATAMTHAGDDVGLADLRSRELGRMGDGPLANLFRILTEPPVHRLADLPQAENDLRRALPGDLNSVR